MLLADPATALEERHVLDPGRGTGQVACYLAAPGARVTAIDISASAIAFAEDMARQRGLDITFIIGDGTVLPLAPETYGVCGLAVPVLYRGLGAARCSIQALVRAGFEVLSPELVPPNDAYGVWMARTLACPKEV